MTPKLRLEWIRESLPPGFDALARMALAEGHRMLARLAADWETAATRFDRPGEALLAAWCDRDLAGIGGLTVDPSITDALRMRRFYVAPAYRRGGIACAIARELLQVARLSGHAITVHAGTPEAAAFWEHLGFKPDRRAGISHAL